MNQLQEIMDWYQTAVDALRVTTRVVGRGGAGILTARHIFRDLPANESLARLGMAGEQLNNLNILAMVAVFERLLRDYVVSIVQSRFQAPGEIETRIAENIQADAEFWNFSNRLVDVFANVPADLRGRVKQFIDFRNWVAHARHAAASPEPAPINVAPKDAHRVLTAFLLQAGLV